MSLYSRLWATLSMVIILTAAGAIRVTAQTQAGSNISSAAAMKKADLANSSIVPPENSTDRTSEISRDGGNSTTLATTNAPGVAAKTASEAEVPRPQTAPTDEWQFQFTPYFWMASLHGTAGIGNRTTQVDESFGDIFDSLKFSFMGVLEARRDKLVVLTDVEYVSISDDKATPGPLFSQLNAKFKTFVFDPEIGYRVFENPDTGAFVDVLGGVRVWHISTDLTFSPGILPGTVAQGSRNWVDGIGGLRGKAPLSKKVFITGKFDLGGGGSKFTYQLFGGVGYNINKRIALILGYRDLDVNYDKNSFLYDMSQRGPLVGVGFKF